MKRSSLLSLCLCLLSLLGAARASAQPLSRQAVAPTLAQLLPAWKDSIKQHYRDAWYQRNLVIERDTMPFWMMYYGDEPADGYSLFISLHGGGTAPKAINDQQYANQMRLYAPKNSLYFVPRAPYDLWNMWCVPQMDRFYEAIIQMAVAYAGVNPDRVYIMGFSAGGDGVWRMAPRMADSWAAAAMMAGHPGDVSLHNLRNLPFTIWCGEHDAAYDRNRLNAERGLELDSFQRADPAGYVHTTHIVPDKGHWMDRVDTAAVGLMQRYTRHPYPATVVWRQEEVVRPSFYWITAPSDQLVRGHTVRLSVRNNVIRITECDYRSLTFSLNDEIVNLDRPVKVVYRGRTVWKGRLTRSADTLRRTLYERNDPRYAFPAQLTVQL